MTPEQAESLLTAAYIVEVEARNRKPLIDDFTQTNIRQLAEYLTTGDKSKYAVMLCGKCGNGKTTLCYALRTVISYYLNEAKAWDEPGEIPSLRICSAKDIAYSCRDNPDTSKYRKERLLAIEDMGNEPKEIMVFGTTFNPIADILEYRYCEQMFTVITTNLRPEEISRLYGERVADRFRESVHKIVFENKSYRSP